MAAKANGFWDFKSYTERTWFKYLVVFLLIASTLYVGIHYLLRDRSYDYEYSRLNQDQMQIINRIYMDAAKPKTTDVQQSNKKDSTKNEKADSAKNGTNPALKIKTSPVARQNVDSLTKGRKNKPLVLKTDTGACKKNLVSTVMNYLNNTFDQGLEPNQSSQISCFLNEATPEEATAFLNSSKGLIVFAFIGGYYSSRVISLMDRLKDVLLPNSGSASLPATNTGGVGSGTIPMIQQLHVQLALSPMLSAATAAAAAATSLNAATVQLQQSGSTSQVGGTHNAGDPTGLFTFTSVTPGMYLIKATLGINAADGSQKILSGQVNGQIISGTAPVVLTLSETPTSS